MTKKEAGGSKYKHKNGKCYQPKPKKQVRFARREFEELLERLDEDDLLERFDEDDVSLFERSDGE